jgi:DNA-binding transcriptional ArsR family regulator
MENKLIDIEKQFEKCAPIFIALGNETRVHIIASIIKKAEKENKCSGMRVGEICACTNLSRPAVSHHLKELKDAGIIDMREEGTKNYYFFNFSSSLEEVRTLLDKVLCLEKHK